MYCIKMTQINDKVMDQVSHCSKYYEYGFDIPGPHIDLRCCSLSDKDTLNHNCERRFKKLGYY